tara:strand:- start:279 stop:626 length:348 start_codon:yes stop_codon:yes gene_type:complete
MELSNEIKEQIKNHALGSSPEECCGFLIDSEEGPLKLTECKNIANDKESFFKISIEEYLNALTDGDITAVYHSHTKGENSFSEVDKSLVDDLEMISVLYNTTTDEFEILRPETDE